MAKIFIIDDDPDIVNLLKMSFENRYHEVAFAHNGNEGLKVIGEFNPDIVVLDVMMERKDEGFDVARALKNDQKYKNIPILMLTGIKNDLGFDFKKEAGDIRWLPVDAYIDKSEDLELIVSKAEELLS